MRYAIVEASSSEALHDTSTRSGPFAAVAVTAEGAVGGLKSAEGCPPLSAAQSTVPPVAAEIACWNAAYEPFGVRSAHSGPDCQPERIGSSASRKLKNDETYG